MTLLPASWMAKTVPSMMSGVRSVGSTPTTVECPGTAAWAAAASPAPGAGRPPAIGAISATMDSTAAPRRLDTRR